MKWPVQRYQIERVFALPRKRVWELLSDTDHLNQMIGLYSVNVMNTAASSGLYKDLIAKVGGIIPLRWKESPFEWEKEKHYAVTREYKSGPLKKFYGGIEISDRAGSNGEEGTFVKVFAEFTPANAIGIAVIPLTGVSAMRKTMTYLENYIRLLEQGKGERPPQPSPGSIVNIKELDMLLEELKLWPVVPKLSAKLKEHLLESGDDGVVDMRPYELAAAWGASRDDVLKVFLYATHVGMTNLSWHLICPNCRVSKSQTEHLSKLTAQFHCDFCGINYQANFDRYVELCFTVHAGIRQASKQLFCIGGPMITPHVHEQTYILPGQTVKMHVPGGDEPYRLRVLKYNQMITIDSALSDDSLIDPGNVIAYTDSGWSRDRIRKPHQDGEITLLNNGTKEIVVVLENCEWDQDKVTAAKVTTMHEFRGLFSSEVLAPGQQVGVENISLLFSDILGSTAFYENVGDAQAYGKVRRHFEFMMDWIHRNHGTLVKTIGDAVMAIFEKPEHALRAALDIQQHVRLFNESLLDEDPIIIKIGVHHGPAIAVNSNDRLDYFGRTVNIASRIQGLSHGGDIIISEVSIQRPEAQLVLKGYEVESESFTSQLRGIDDEMALTRLQVLLK